jgi:Reprolysin (M12B) family zinc metalloprotease
MMKKSIFILLLSCFPILSQAQADECQIPGVPSAIEDVGDCANTFPYPLGNPCGGDLAYAPLVPEHTPIKTVRIVTHVIQRGDGSDNFQDTPAHKDFLYKIFNDEWLSANVLYGSTCDNPNSPSPHIVDTRIRFQTDFQNDLFLWQSDTYFCEGGWSGDGCQMYEEFVTNNSILTVDQKENALHVFYAGCELESDGVTENYVLGGYASGVPNLDGPNFIGMKAVYHRHFVEQYEQAVWNARRLMAHELGHSFGLHHTTTTDQCDDTGSPHLNNVMYSPANTRCSFSECQISRMHFYLENERCINNNGCSSIHNAVIRDYCQLTSGEDITITSGQDYTWTSEKKLKGHLRINDGGKLTIRCRVGMPENARIIIEPGGSLIVDNGIITGNCDKRWQGITVAGNRYQSQASTSKQGRLTVRNQSLIENTIEAISLYAATPINTSPPENTTGGVVRAFNSTFRNNQRTVHFKPYQNWNSQGIYIGNVSYFDNCTFIIDQTHTGSFTEHARLNRVDGINFRGCDFSYQKEPVAGAAIRAIDAHFNATALCGNGFPCQWDRATFSGFYTAIHCTASGGSLYTYSVDRSDFTDNLIGIQSNAVNMPLITRNTFAVVLNGAPSASTPAGVIINGGTGYTIQENHFDDDPSGMTGVQKVGLVIRETGSGMNQVRRNTYNNLYVGNLSNGDNRNEADADYGLVYLCNENLGANRFDFSVPNELFNPDTEYGIAQNQGSNQLPAGNVFSQNGNNPESDFHNQSTWAVNYFYFNNAADENPLSISNFVNKIATTASSSCTIEFPGFTEPGPGKESDLSSEYWDAFSTRSGLKQSLQSQMDGGNTTAVLNQIAQSDAGKAAQLTNYLLSLSPWLSQTVLESAANHTAVLSHSQLYDILLANPDESKKQSMLTFLANKPVPMPGNMIQALEGATFTATARTHPEANIAYHSGRVVSAAARLTHHFLTDTLPQNSASIALWLPRQESLESSMALVDFYLQTGNIALATQWLNDIPQQMALSPKQQVEFNHFNSLKQLQMSLLQQGKTVYDLTAGQLQPLVNLAETSRGIAGLQAKNILNNGFGGEWYDELILPDLQSGGSREATVKSISKKDQIYAFPNPASQQVQFHYRLENNYRAMSIKVHDGLGKLIAEIPVDNEHKEGFVSWDAAATNPGVYIYSICSQGHVLVADKLIIIKE